MMNKNNVVSNIRTEDDASESVTINDSSDSKFCQSSHLSPSSPLSQVSLGSNSSSSMVMVNHDVSDSQAEDYPSNNKCNERSKDDEDEEEMERVETSEILKEILSSPIRSAEAHFLCQMDMISSLSVSIEDPIIANPILIAKSTSGESDRFSPSWEEQNVKYSWSSASLYPQESFSFSDEEDNTGEHKRVHTPEMDEPENNQESESLHDRDAPLRDSFCSSETVPTIPIKEHDWDHLQSIVLTLRTEGDDEALGGGVEDEVFSDTGDFSSTIADDGFTRPNNDMRFAYSHLEMLKQQALSMSQALGLLDSELMEVTVDGETLFLPVSEQPIDKILDLLGEFRNQIRYTKDKLESLEQQMPLTPLEEELDDNCDDNMAFALCDEDLLEEDYDEDGYDEDSEDDTGAEDNESTSTTVSVSSGMSEDTGATDSFWRSISQDHSETNKAAFDLEMEWEGRGGSNDDSWLDEFLHVHNQEVDANIMALSYDWNEFVIPAAENNLDCDDNVATMVLNYLPDIGSVTISNVNDALHNCLQVAADGFHDVYHRMGGKGSLDDEMILTLSRGELLALQIASVSMLALSMGLLLMC